ncbi:squalene-hopene-cyclase, partial [Metarhizium majus ARSEF 297]
MASTTPSNSVVGLSDHRDTKAAAEYKTDLSRWRLNVELGRHMWEYVADDQVDNSSNTHQGNALHNQQSSRPQSFLEQYWLGREYSLPKMARPARPSEALDNGWEFFKRLQTEDGHWGCNDDGPLFVTSGIVISSYIIGIPFPEPMKHEMIRYLLNFANSEGGWGLWINSPSTVFGTAMNYVMLRILGLSPHHPAGLLINQRVSILLQYIAGNAIAINCNGLFFIM